MQTALGLRPLIHAGRLAAVLIALAMLAHGVRPAVAQAPDDGCDPDEPIACLPLPGEIVPSAPATATPRIAPPPTPCPPPGVVQPRIAPPPSSNCDRRAVIAAVNRANALYARALRTWDGNELPAAWSGEALAQVRGYIQDMRGRGVYGTFELLAITLEQLRVNGNRATVRTLENWLVRENSRLTGRVTYQQNGWFANRYELEGQNGIWRVVRNDVREASAPLPPPPPAPRTPPCVSIFPSPPGCVPSLGVSLSVSTDRPGYGVGEMITATVSNTGTIAVSGGGGYRCGLVDVELNVGQDQWVRAPGGAAVCPAIALILHPGETRAETFRAGPDAGLYRLAVRVSSDSGDGGTFYSTPFSVFN